MKRGAANVQSGAIGRHTPPWACCDNRGYAVVMQPDDPTRDPSAPYCSNCGYPLLGLTESSRCPECGKPLVEVLVRDSFPGKRGHRWQSHKRLFGLPLVSIAYGPWGREAIGRPRGIVAIGDMPRGIIAIGGRAFGVIAVGGFAFGGIALGGFSLGILGIGGFTGGIAAVGGYAMGLFTFGGMVVPFIRGIGGKVISPWFW